MARGPSGATVILALASTTALITPASAACIVSGGVMTCTGTVSNLFSDGEVSSVVVEDLTGNVTGGTQNQSVGLSADPSSNGGDGEDGGSASVTFDGQGYGITSPGDGSPPDFPPSNGIGAYSYGGNAASGDHDTKFAGNAHADKGGRGGDGGATAVTIHSGFVDYTSNLGTALVISESIGGDGGPGGEAKVDTGGAAYGGDGGVGGTGGSASVSIVSGRFNLSSTSGNDSYGVLALSSGGNTGGDGGEGESHEGDAHGGDGGTSNDGGSATVDITSASITLDGVGTAVAARSIGGDAPTGGFGHARGDGASYGGQGGYAGDAGAATVNLGSGGIEITAKGGARAVEVLSQGGDGGSGGHAETDDIGDSHGGFGGLAGSGGSATLSLSSGVSITAEANIAVHVASFGGTGPAGGDATTNVVGSHSGGGDGFFGTSGGTVTITSTDGPATFSTGSSGSHAVIAESIGGQGGAGGDATARLIGDAQGGDGGAGGKGGAVNVDLWADVTTQNNRAQGVFARSYGGSGGNGGNAHATAGKGSGGAAAGSAPGGNVSLTYKGSVATRRTRSSPAVSAGSPARAAMAPALAVMARGARAPATAARSPST